MYRKLTLVLVGLLMVAVSGCATVTRGTTDVLEIQTDPAGAQVETTNGYSCASTPCALEMDRDSELVVNITKDGCKPVAMNVTHETADAGAAGVAGNILAGGIIGLAVDAGSGASQDLVPNPVVAKLEC